MTSRIAPRLTLPTARRRWWRGNHKAAKELSMRLTELNPRWVTFQNPPPEDEGKRWYIAISFDCPHCRSQRIVVYFEPEIDDGYSWKFSTWEHFANRGHEGPRWHRTGETFEDITLTPSVDVSQMAHWHGFIENGVIK